MHTTSSHYSTHLFDFLSSYRGQADYRRRADGKRYSVTNTEPGTIHDGWNGPVATEVSEEWRIHRHVMRDAFVTWMRSKDWNDDATIARYVTEFYADVLADEVAS